MAHSGLSIGSCKGGAVSNVPTGVNDAYCYSSFDSHEIFDAFDTCCRGNSPIIYDAAFGCGIYCLAQDWSADDLKKCILDQNDNAHLGSYILCDTNDRETTITEEPTTNKGYKNTGIISSLDGEHGIRLEIRGDSEKTNTISSSSSTSTASSGGIEDTASSLYNDITNDADPTSTTSGARSTSTSSSGGVEDTVSSLYNDITNSTDPTSTTSSTSSTSTSTDTSDSGDSSVSSWYQDIINTITGNGAVVSEPISKTSMGFVVLFSCSAIMCLFA
ncbi:hypothetical protein N7462_004527 [Penicillium macrosclerotiorum]|uniref:uncharacterized protein n=1 Tax=Penicillium macrosclerotiorum TaxID=303699 RepID=UPI0025481A03|nr:uncharacterized protein N7462_004527 [Penicillium macrosclerotiorum]KAJ5690135.1 hypothetical protein N7462_004527 [Penicillium macrosclerotiorum]